VRAARIGVVGAGILGLAVARRLTRAAPGASVVVVDKEDRVAAHQSGRSSGVVHAGIYYAPGSLKARLCRRGVELLREYCAERRLPFEQCGKTVLALDEVEVDRLRAIEQRARANGVPDVRWLDGDELGEVEPNAVGMAALHSPTTAVTDYGAISAELARDVAAAGGSVRLGLEITGIEQVDREVRVSGRGDAFAVDLLVICAGLQSDRLARLAGDVRGPAIVPFRGEYYRLGPGCEDLVRGLLYPVPDPAYPFLGVHLTRRVSGGVDVGPNAVLALAREGYRRRDVRLRDVWETVAWPGFRRLARAHWRMGLDEFRCSLSKQAYAARARRYVPSLDPAALLPAPAGIRAQAVDADGSLVDDFRISRIGRVVAVRNAPSPGATSSLAIAEHVVDGVLEQVGTGRPV
jgi:(S)-2-hydroxyglutarate dehydrogenase